MGTINREELKDVLRDVLREELQSLLEALQTGKRTAKSLTSDELLTQTEVADAMRISKVTLIRREREGHVNPIRFGKRIFYKKSEIEKLMLTGCV